MYRANVEGLYGGLIARKDLEAPQLSSSSGDTNLPIAKLGNHSVPPEEPPQLDWFLAGFLIGLGLILLLLFICGLAHRQILRRRRNLGRPHVREIATAPYVYEVDL